MAVPAVFAARVLRMVLPRADPRERRDFGSRASPEASKADSMRYLMPGTGQLRTVAKVGSQTARFSLAMRFVMTMQSIVKPRGEWYFEGRSLEKPFAR